MYTRQIIKKNKTILLQKMYNLIYKLFIIHCVLKNLPYILDKNDITKNFKKVSNLI